MPRIAFIFTSLVLAAELSVLTTGSYPDVESSGIAAPTPQFGPQCEPCG